MSADTGKAPSTGSWAWMIPTLMLVTCMNCNDIRDLESDVRALPSAWDVSSAKRDCERDVDALETRVEKLERESRDRKWSTP